MTMPVDRIMLAKEVLVDLLHAMEKLNELDTLMCQHAVSGLIGDCATMMHSEVMSRAGKA